MSFSSRSTKKYIMNTTRLALTKCGSYHGPNSALDPSREYDAFQSYAWLVVYRTGLFNSSSISALVLLWFRTNTVDDSWTPFPLKTNTNGSPLSRQVDITRARTPKLLALQKIARRDLVPGRQRPPQLFRQQHYRTARETRSRSIFKCRRDPTKTILRYRRDVTSFYQFVLFAISRRTAVCFSTFNCSYRFCDQIAYSYSWFTRDTTLRSTGPDENVSTKYGDTAESDGN